MQCSSQGFQNTFSVESSSNFLFQLAIIVGLLPAFLFHQSYTGTGRVPSIGIEEADTKWVLVAAWHFPDWWNFLPKLARSGDPRRLN